MLIHDAVCSGGTIARPGIIRELARRACWLSLVLCLPVLVAGCGGKRRSADHVELTGRVLYRDKPVTGGTLNFITSDGFSSSGRIDPDGNYTINAPVGEVKITIDNRMLKPNNRPAKAAARGVGKPDAPDPDPVKGKYVAIPTKYFSPDTSDASLTVTKDTKDHDIILKD